MEPCNVYSHSLVLQGSELVTQSRTGGDESTCSHIDELFGMTHVLQVVMNMEYKLEPIRDISHKLVEDTSLHPWGILYESAFIFKDSFLVCIVTQRIKGRKLLTHAANGS